MGRLLVDFLREIKEVPKKTVESRFVQYVAANCRWLAWLIIARHDMSTHDKMRRVFGRKSDPFGYSESAYELLRYEAMESAISAHRFGDVLEVGCAEGLFTRRLARYSARIVALDISSTALRRAKANCAGMPVTYVKANVRYWDTADTFDLIVLADVVYYLGAPHKGPVFASAADEFSQKMKRFSRIGGRILLANGFGTPHDEERNRDYRGRLEKRGFKTESSTVVGVKSNASFKCSLDVLIRAE